MSFSFGFSGEDYDSPEMEVEGAEDMPAAAAMMTAGPNGASIAPSSSSSSSFAQTSSPPAKSPIARLIALSTVLDRLPSRISYSTIAVPLAGNEVVVLPRRDLFDARFQVLNEGSSRGAGAGEEEREAMKDDEVAVNGEEGDEEQEMLVDAESDLIPGLYEGGLKTWECSLDLVRVLHDMVTGNDIDLTGKRIVELGCGTALPSMYLFHHLLSLPPPGTSDSLPVTETQLHLSDFNSLVLSLVTIPNLVLVYYFSTLIQSGEPLPNQGEVDLDESLLSGFTTALQDRGIEILLHSGPWEGLSLPSSSTPFSSEGAQDEGETERATPDLILSSETTYNSQTIDSLCSTLLRLTSSPPSPSPPSLSQRVILIATKNYYFGLGGGVVAFLRRLEELVGQGSKVEVEHVMQSHTGVKRCVLSIGWV